MSRPQKMHQPIKGDFSSILAAIAMGSGKGKKTAKSLKARKKISPENQVAPK